MTRAIIIAIIAVAVALLLLCVGILLKKGGKFSSEHISANRRMRQDGIHCANSQDREARRRAHQKLNIKDL